MKSNTYVLQADNPITNSEEDVLKRTSLAESFATQVFDSDFTRGLVFGVLGPWGSGKTSFINLARKIWENKDIPIIDFNPWIFSGSDQLVDSFFTEIGAQLKLKTDFSEVGEKLQEYGDTLSGFDWLPVIGKFAKGLSGISKLVGKTLKQQKSGLDSKRKEISEQLCKSAKPIVVVIDDIDRLTNKEIHDVFKLVRLVASFPFIIYIVAFDRKRVEAALESGGLPGKDYLEKILQMAVDMPSVPQEKIDTQLFQLLNSLFESTEAIRFADERWSNAYLAIIRPLLHNMRDVKRYVMSASLTFRELGNQIEAVDILCLEAIRVFLPNVFWQITLSVEALTTKSSVYEYQSESNGHRQQIEKLLDASGQYSNLVKSLITLIFPAAQSYINGAIYGTNSIEKWVASHRVAAKDYLNLYLQRVDSTEITSLQNAEKALALMGSSVQLEIFFLSLPPAQRIEALISLRDLRQQIDKESIASGVVGLLNISQDVPSKPGGLFAVDGRSIVGQIVFMFLDCLQDQLLVESIVSKVLPQLKTLTAYMELIEIVGYDENAGHQLVSEDTARSFESEFRNKVRSASAEQLAREPELLRILYLLSENAEGDGISLVVPDSTDVTLSLLRSSYSESYRQTISQEGTVAHTEGHLIWEILIMVLGDENELASRVDKVRLVVSEEDKYLVDLADKYLAGWRPVTYEIGYPGTRGEYLNFF